MRRYTLIEREKKEANVLKIELVINIIMSYFQDKRKCYSFLFMDLSVFIEDSVLVQFARSSTVVLG